MTRIWLFGVLASGCAPDFSAALVLTIEDSPLSAGGYQIDLRGPDGAAVQDVNETFVAFRSGGQEVSILLSGDDVFGGRDSADARVNVRAVPTENAGSVARGSVVITLKRHDIVEATVALLADPRPLGATGRARYALGSAGTSNAQVTLTTTGLDAPGPYLIDAWLTDGAGEVEWVGRLDAQFVLFSPTAHGSFIATAGFQLLVTAEPLGSPQPLAAPAGWPLLSGGLNIGLAKMLMGAPGTVGGHFSAVDLVIDLVVQHKDFAIGAGSTVEAIRHAEHVYTALAGEAASSQRDANNRMLGDLNGDGQIEFVTSDRRGIGVDDTTGYRGLMAQAFTPLEAIGGQAVIDANNCRANFGTAVSDSLAEAANFAQDPAAAGADTAFDAAVERLVGQSYDPATSDPATDNQLTLTCMIEILADLAQTLDLEVVPFGQ
ncbi:MAG: hypothetical protein HYZ27_07675, partial [Deltaproteobacteria bacterium]|nr:hypothetical protein [Deltaproteobacteria bacterium]